MRTNPLMTEMINVKYLIQLRRTKDKTPSSSITIPAIQAFSNNILGLEKMQMKLLRLT